MKNTREIRQTKQVVLSVLAAVFCVLAVTGCKENYKKITINSSDVSKQMLQAFFDKDLKKDFEKENFDEYMKNLEVNYKQNFPQVEVKNELKHGEYENTEIYSLTKEGYENIVIYIHGGAWVFEIDKLHVAFCDELATRLNAKVFIPLYQLAPTSTYESDYQMFINLYGDIQTLEKPIYIMGDSAGGNIAMELVHKVREKGMVVPDGLVILHGCMDMSFSNPDIEKYAKKDPMLEAYGCRECAKMWAGTTNLKAPELSPLFCDVEGFPKTLFFAGTNDILTPDILLMCKKMSKAGDDVTLVLGKGLWHVFSIFDIPEKEESLDIITDFCLN